LFSTTPGKLPCQARQEESAGGLKRLAGG